MGRKKSKKHNTEEHAQHKREGTRDSEFLPSHGDKKMEIASYMLGITAAIGFVVFGAVYSSHKTASIWFIFLPSTLILIVGGCLYWQNLVWNERAKPTTEKQLENPTFRENVGTATLFFGGNTATSSVTELERQRWKPFNFMGVEPVIYAEKGRVYVDVVITDGTGHLPVEIKKDEFVVRPVNWDRNVSTEALEVVNEDLIPVFQFVFRTPSKIEINGIFTTPKGDIILVDGNGVRVNPIPRELSLKRIFKYPSWKYPSQYEEK